MKNTFKYFTALFLSVTLLQSCGNFTSPDLLTVEGIQSISESLADTYPETETLNLAKVNFMGSELKQDIYAVQGIYKLDNGNFKNTSFNLTTGRSMDFPVVNPSYESLDKRTMQPFKAFDFSKIPDYIKSAEEQVLESNPTYALESVRTYEVYAPLNGKEGMHKIKLQFTDSEEGKTMQGRNIITNYYEFDFKVENNNVQFVE